jgi:hypothetical protein
MAPDVAIAIRERQTPTSVKETQRFVGFYGLIAVLRVHAYFFRADSWKASLFFPGRGRGEWDTSHSSIKEHQRGFDGLKGVF